jgi:hypothetical protein
MFDLSGVPVCVVSPSLQAEARPRPPVPPPGAALVNEDGQVRATRYFAVCVLFLLPLLRLAAGCGGQEGGVVIEEPEPDGKGDMSSPRRSVAPAGCELPEGYTRGRIDGFPETADPVIGHRTSPRPDMDVFGVHLRATVVFCRPGSGTYARRYRYYLDGPFSGRWLRPPLHQPL